MLLLLFAFLLNFQGDSLSISAEDRFVQKIDSLQKSSILENGTLGVSIRNCKTGNQLIGFNEKKALRPASTLKLVTTATALALLGENFRYSTHLETRGIIRNDTLFGNIIIRGSGDPTLGSWRFDETLDYSRLFVDWATKINQLKIKVITGDIIANAEAFSDNNVPETWQWGDMGNYYGAAGFGININENLFRAHFATGKISNEKTNLFKIEPSIQDTDIINSVVADKETHFDDVLFFSAPISNLILAKGKLPLNRADFIVKGSIPNPPDLTTHLLKNALGKMNIIVLNKEKVEENSPSQIVDIVKSPSLFEMSLYCNYESINLYAECLLKTIPATESKKANTENGIEILRKYWEDKSLNLKGLYMKDGSGLSTSNTITANLMTEILAKAPGLPFFNAFHQSIPVLGRDGTVKNIAKNKIWAKNFSVKSGTIEKAKAFAGYFKNKNGDLFSFAIMANQFEGSESGMSRELAKLFEAMYELK
ncbi:MAG: D-alanyl-D-alanine carboxypeptidase/D-alanyl-D-alanine-endopeptidase [Bacteroidota bacterium]